MRYRRSPRRSAARPTTAYRACDAARRQPDAGRRCSRAAAIRTGGLLVFLLDALNASFPTIGCSLVRHLLTDASRPVTGAAGLGVAALSGTSVARDRPFSTAKLIAMKWGPAPEERDLGTGGGNTDPGGQFSVEQIERFRCTSAGNP